MKLSYNSILGVDFLLRFPKYSPLLILTLNPYM